MNGVMLTMIIITVIMGVIGTLTMSSLFQTKNIVGKSMGSALGEAAATKITMAFRNGLVTSVDGYTLVPDDLSQIATAPSSAVLDNASNPLVPAPFRSGGFHPGMAQVTVHELGTDTDGNGVGDGDGFWQVLRIIPPTAGTSRDVVVWVRTIRGTGTGPQSVGTFALRFRNTPFSSYQMVSDSELQLDANATISGNLHVNGNGVAEGANAVRATGHAACTQQPRITTARGGVDAARFPGCVADANRGRALDLAKGDELVRTLATMCPTVETDPQPIRCIGAPGAGGSWNVQLHPDRVTWDGGNVQLPSANDLDDPGTVLLFRGSVAVAGSTNGRVTIVAWDADAVSPPLLHVVGNVESASPTASVGLVAHGDIIVDGAVAPSCAVDRISAALFSGAGRLALPASLTAAGITATPCPMLTLTGSVSGRNGPLLSWHTEAGESGYQQRSYVFDRDLLTTPPPMFPEASQWKVATSRDLPSSCAQGPGGAAAALPAAQARTC